MKNSQHQIIPSEKNCERLVCRMGVSDQIFLFGTLFPDMGRKFWPYCSRFLLASKRNPRCVYGASLCNVTLTCCTSLWLPAASRSSRGRGRSWGRPCWGSTWAWCRTGSVARPLLQASETQLLTPLSPSPSHTWRWGVLMPGLCQDTSFQPMSSPRMTIRWLGDRAQYRTWQLRPKVTIKLDFY